MLLKKGHVYWLENPEIGIHPAVLLTYGTNQIHVGFEFQSIADGPFYRENVNVYLAMDYDQNETVKEILTARTWKLHEQKPE